MDGQVCRRTAWLLGHDTEPDTDSKRPQTLYEKGVVIFLPYIDAYTGLHYGAISRNSVCSIPGALTLA